jgi:hypothetical protein
MPGRKVQVTLDWAEDTALLSASDDHGRGSDADR